MLKKIRCYRRNGTGGDKFLLCKSDREDKGGE